MPKKSKSNKSKEVSIGSFTKEEHINIFNDFKTYCKLSGVKANETIANLMKELLKDKTLTNDYIILKEPLYFNIDTLIKEGYAVATSEKPTYNYSNIAKILKIPNNMDRFNSILNTYCYIDSNINESELNESELKKELDKYKNNHLGIEPYEIPIKQISEKGFIIKLAYITFNYKNDVLKLGLLESQHLKHFLDHVKYEKEIETLETTEIKRSIELKNNNYSIISSYIMDYDTIFRVENYIKQYARAIIELIESILDYMYFRKKEYNKMSVLSKELAKIDAKPIEKKLDVLEKKQLEGANIESERISLENEFNEIVNNTNEIKKELDNYTEKDTALIKRIKENKAYVETKANAENLTEVLYISKYDFIENQDYYNEVITNYVENTTIDLEKFLDLLKDAMTAKKPILTEKEIDSKIKEYENFIELSKDII